MNEREILVEQVQELQDRTQAIRAEVERLRAAEQEYLFEQQELRREIALPTNRLRWCLAILSLLLATLAIAMQHRAPGNVVAEAPTAVQHRIVAGS